MTATVLADHVRRAAHGLHRCALCGRPIPARTKYSDRRIADNGTAYTWREHLACADLLERAARYFAIGQDEAEAVTSWLEIVEEYQTETDALERGWPAVEAAP